MIRSVGYYIIEDDPSVINVLQDIIEDRNLGTVVGTSGENGADIEEILLKKPDIILVDFLMPGKDGMQVVRELRERGCAAKIVMISQVSSKDMIGKAYTAGIDFFINKPINLIEVTTVLKNVETQMKNEKAINNLRNMLMTEMADMPTEVMPVREAVNDDYGKKVRYILNRIGMSGEKGAEDIVKHEVWEDYEVYEIRCAKDIYFRPDGEAEQHVQSYENYVLLFSRSGGYMINIGGSLPMETLEHIARELEVRDTGRELVYPNPGGDYRPNLINIVRG